MHQVSKSLLNKKSYYKKFGLYHYLSFFNDIYKSKLLHICVESAIPAHFADVRVYQQHILQEQSLQ